MISPGIGSQENGKTNDKKMIKNDATNGDEMEKPRIVVVFLWCFCGGVFAVVFLCGGVCVVVFLWWCLCGGVFVVVW